jgi:hypothetical protein
MRAPTRIKSRSHLKNAQVELDTGKVLWPSRSGSFQEVQSAGGERRFVVVDYAGMDAIVAREVGKRRVQCTPVNEAVTDLIPGDRDTWTPDWRQRPKKLRQTVVRRDGLSNAKLNATRSALFATEARSIMIARGSVATDD